MGVDIIEYYTDSDGDTREKWIGRVNSKGFVYVESTYTKYDDPYPYTQIGQVSVDYQKKEICVYDVQNKLVGKSIVKIEDGELVNLVYQGEISNDWNKVVGYMNANRKLCIAYGCSDKMIAYLVGDQEASDNDFYFASSAYFLLLRGKCLPQKWIPHKIQKNATHGIMKAMSIMDKVVLGYDTALPAFNKTREYMETVDNQGVYKTQRCKSCGLGYSIDLNSEHLCSGCFKMIHLGNKINIKQCRYCGKKLPESCMTEYDVCYECSAYS